MTERSLECLSIVAYRPSGPRRFAPLLLGMVLFCLAMGCRDKTKEEIARLNSSISTELGPQSTYVDVLAFLDKHHIEHGEFERAEVDKEPEQAQVGREPLNVKGVRGRIRGIVRKVDSDILSRSDVQLVFLFDSGGKMLAHSVYKVITAP